MITSSREILSRCPALYLQHEPRTTGGNEGVHFIQGSATFLRLQGVETTHVVTLTPEAPSPSFYVLVMRMIHGYSHASYCIAHALQIYLYASK
jgi:hypothetical protein